jgi:hypothetical protein
MLEQGTGMVALVTAIRNEGRRLLPRRSIGQRCRVNQVQAIGMIAAHNMLFDDAGRGRPTAPSWSNASTSKMRPA